MPTGTITFSNVNGWDQNSNFYNYRISFLVAGVERSDELVRQTPLNPVWVQWEIPNGMLSAGDDIDMFVVSVYPQTNPTSTPHLVFDWGSTNNNDVGGLCNDMHYAHSEINNITT